MNYVERQEYWEVLGKRAAACKHWSWYDGMLFVYYDTHGQKDRERFSRGDIKFGREIWPDLEDPATLGWLLYLVRVNWKDPFMCTDHSGDLWWAVTAGGGTVCGSIAAALTRAKGGHCCIGGPCHVPAVGKTEGEALVVALEGVP